MEICYNDGFGGLAYPSQFSVKLATFAEGYAININEYIFGNLNIDILIISALLMHIILIDIKINVYMLYDYHNYCYPVPLVITVTNIYLRTAKSLCTHFKLARYSIHHLVICMPNVISSLMVGVCSNGYVSSEWVVTSIIVT